MPGTFLGKWTIYIPATPELNIPWGYASYTDGRQQDDGTFLGWYNGPQTPPPKLALIAFIQRADGKLCFLLNNGQYVGFNGMFLWVSTLESATAFGFPGHNQQSLPTPFAGPIQFLGDGTYLGVLWGFFIAGQDATTESFTMTQITPTLPSVQASGNGDGLDFAWVDLTGATLEKVSLVKADFSHCNLTNAKFTNVNFTGAILTNANLTGATYNNCVLDGALLNNCTLTNTNFTGSTLLGTHLEGSTFQGTILSNTRVAGAIFKESDLTSVIADPIPQFYNVPLAPPSPTNPRTTLSGCRLNLSLIASDWSMLDLTSATILGLSSPLSSATKPLKATYAILKGLNNNNLVGLSLQSAVFNNAVLDGLGLNTSGAHISDLTNASFIQASMHGTNLSGAILKAANMTGAQLGSLGQLFSLPASFEADLNAGSSVDAALRGQFTQHDITLSATATISVLAPNRVWQLNDVGNSVIYTIRLETNASNTQILTVYAPATSASLIDAYMPDAVLTGANLYGVLASGAQFYGGNARLDGFAILERAELNDANLSNLNLTQANLFGANLSGAQLFNAKFNKANLSPSADGVATNLSGANLQGADFTDAQLLGTNLANAAVAVNVPTKANPTQGGIYLFSLPYVTDTHTLQQYTAELNAAATLFSLNPNGDAATLQKFVTALETNNLGPIKTAFVKHQPPIVLSNNAQIQTIDVGTVWQIVDGPLSYTVWEDLDENSNTELYVAPSLTITRAAFQQNNIALRWQASAAIDTAGQQWLLDNDSENPQNFSTGYVKFILSLNGSVLDVYGAAVRVERLGDNQQLQMDTENCNVTALAVTNMNGQTVCPNGTALSVNQQSGENWDKLWLRAATPPKPPACVPTDYNWCPSTSRTKEKATGYSN